MTTTFLSPEQSVRTLLSRYRGATIEALTAVLCPILVPIRSIDRTVYKVEGQSHWRASFELELTQENASFIQVGRTGKFVPNAHSTGELWREIAKGRITSINRHLNVASGEIYIGGGNKAALISAVDDLNESDFLEIDQYGAAAKVLSGLAEYYLVQYAISKGYDVVRMPEDMARHLGAYANYDFQFTKNGVTKGVEVKSLWGTDTRRARLIHSLTQRPKGPESRWTAQQKKNYYPTSSCKFETQDIFAVSLFLRTGNIRDFAFARSIPEDVKPYGLPRASAYPVHVHQNPICEVGNGIWFSDIDDVWRLP